MPQSPRSNRGGYLAAVFAAATGILVVWEGMNPVAVHERVDPPGVITVCIGRTNYDDPSLKAGQRYTKDQCKQFLKEDLPRYNAMVNKCVHVDLSVNERAALLSFVYNVGQGTLCKSSVAREFNAGNHRAGCGALMRYTRANGVVLRGLENRRRAELKLCLSKD